MPDAENLGRKWKFVAVLILTAWYGFFLVQKIDLTAADLGRHLMNGNLVYQSLVTGNSSSFHSVLTTNFYSYTNQDFPTINHHWGSGLVFFLIQRVAGFEGLSLLFIFLSLAGFFIFLALLFKKEATRWLFRLRFF